jgi:tRNA 2-selenouridine synthase
LHALRDAGAQVLDLEDLACHRSSVLGLIPGQAQPSQKKFDTLIWDALSRFDPHRTVFVEAESRKVGNLSVPEPLMQAMRASPCVRIDVGIDLRVELLMQDYRFFVNDVEFLCARLETLKDLRGQEMVQAWCQAARSGRVAEVVHQLLQDHYDPGYAHSTRRNYVQFDQAPTWSLGDLSPQGLQQIAAQMSQQVQGC